MGEMVWIGKLLQKDATSGLCLTLVRGVFQTEQDAREVAKAFGCDCLMSFTPCEVVQLGQLVVVKDVSTMGV